MSRWLIRAGCISNEDSNKVTDAHKWVLIVITTKLVFFSYNNKIIQKDGLSSTKQDYLATHVDCSFARGNLLTSVRFKNGFNTVFNVH